MKLNHALGYTVAALGLSFLVAGDALADQSWQGYAPRCQTRELAADMASRDPCEAHVATFGVAGPTVLSRNDSFDVETTGSLDSDARQGRGGSRSQM